MQKELEAEEIYGEWYVSAGNAMQFFGVSAKVFNEWEHEFGLEAWRFRGKGNRKYFKKEDLVNLIPKLRYKVNGSQPEK